MITELQQEQASLYVVGALTGAEHEAFGTALRASAELREFVFTLQQTTGLLAMGTPFVKPPAELKDKVLRRLETAAGREDQPVTPHPSGAVAGLAGLHFL